MGSGVSHTNTQRLRSMLVVKAYNARDENETLAEQFSKVAMTAEDGSMIISINEIVEALNLHPIRARQMFRRCGDKFLTGYLDFSAFIDFLENGIWDDNCKSGQTTGTQSGNNNEESRMGSESSGAAAQGSPSRYILRSKERRRRARHFETMYPQVPIALGMKFAGTSSEIHFSHGGGGGAAFKLARSRVPTKDERRLIVRSSSGSGKFNTQSFAQEPLERREAPGLWRKREIVIQERRTEYTKIDANGVRQDLVESEKSHTEILHMETEGGEFAHKEKTQYEQFEKFNDDVVQQQEGSEEFVHLKSKEDEYSHFESSMPENNESAPPMPDPPDAIVPHSEGAGVQSGQWESKTGTPPGPPLSPLGSEDDSFSTQ